MASLSCARWTEASASFPIEIGPEITHEIERCLARADDLQGPLMLVAVGGLQLQDVPFSGDLGPTDYLAHCPRLRALLGRVLSPLGRVWLCRGAGAAALPTHCAVYRNPAHAHFFHTCCYRIGTEYLLLMETWRGHPAGGQGHPFDGPRLGWATVDGSASDTGLRLAPTQLPVLSPQVLRGQLAEILAHCRGVLSQPDSDALAACAEHFAARWDALDADFGSALAGEWSYQSALNYFREVVVPRMELARGRMDAPSRQATARAAELIASQLTPFAPPAPRIDPVSLSRFRRRNGSAVADVRQVPGFDRPLFIVSVPRAGSTLLFETLAGFPDVWSTGAENHAWMEEIPGLHPAARGFDSNRLEAADATGSVRRAVLAAFTGRLHDRGCHYYLDMPADRRPAAIRFLEKTPKNALRIPFLSALFPDALFLYLYREFESNVSSLIDGWRSLRFIAYRDLPGFENRHWSFFLPPGWRAMHDRSIADIASYQWATGNRVIREDLARLPPAHWLAVAYEALIARPEEEMRRIARFAGLAWDDAVQARCDGGLPISRLTLTPPDRQKWRKHARILASCRPQWLPV